ncbi:hypothetical protein F5888DRAFT_1655357 [Russula emetica]|nr:hypothetical protein F5888DRAFT_1655357 [Russula emetica]
MPGSDTSLFKHALAASTVRVDQVSRGGGQEIADIFRNHIGPIRNVEFFDNGPSMEITFFNPDDAIKSLTMSGYMVSGHPIPRIVSARPPPKPRATILSKSPDARRNLYVLGLPFDLSLTELSSIFSHLAKAAMDNISQTNIRWSMVDVSWAVVQRSQGFLDGGDRAATLEGQVDSAPPSSDRGVVPAFKLSNALSDNSKTANSLSGASLSGAHSGPTSIVVHNLPALLFAQDSDLEPLFCPFGEVKGIRKQGPSSSSQSRAGTISVLVTYLSVTGAREAKIALHGQTYGDIPLIVESFPPFYNQETNLKPGRDHLSRSSLNPSASPFVIGTASAPPTCPISEDFPDYFSKPKLNSLAPTSHGHRSLPASNLPSRSNSAVSAASWSVPVARQSFYA